MASSPSARQLLLPPLALLISIPFALMAWITTTIAITVLLCRATVVYIELAIVIVPHYLFGAVLSDPPAVKTVAVQSVNTPRRKRRQSSSSTLSSSAELQRPHTEAVVNLAPSIGVTRDFEGLGGWRLDGASDDEGPWLRSSVDMDPPPVQEATKRHHHRSLTSGAVSRVKSRLHRSYSEEARMNISRARTPLRADGPDEEDYFLRLI